MGIGSGGNYALAAAKALMDSPSAPRRSPARPCRSPPRSASTPTPTSSSKPSTAANDQLLPPRDRLRARPLYRRPEGRQARGCHRAAQPLAAPAAARGPERGGAAQEHPDDRPHRLRQDRDLAPPGPACGRAVPQGGGHQVHRGRLRRPRCRFHRARPGRGRHRPHPRGQAQGSEGTGREERRGTRARRPGRRQRLAGHARELPAAAAGQSAQRQGDRDPGRRDGRAVSDLRHSRRPGRHDQPERDAGQGLRPAHQAAQDDRGQGLRHPDRAGERQPARPGPDRAGCRAQRRERRHRLPRRDRQDLRALGDGPHRRRCVARGRAARSAAAARGHHRVDQVRAGEDRPRAVHRLRRLPHGQAVRPAAGDAGPAADPRRAEAAHQGGLPPHPHRAGGEPHQAVRGADADRGRDAAISPTIRSTPWPTSPLR